MTARHLLALNGRKGNIVRTARADLRAQHLVMMIEEQGLHPERARIRLGISESTSRKYRSKWGSWSSNLWAGRGSR